MIPTRIWSLAVLVALLGCRDKPPSPPDIALAMPNLPLPPNPVLVSKSGGANAVMVTFRTALKPGDVEAYYRSVLTGPGWRLVKHTTDRAGAVTMLAEQNGPPLWVRIRGTPDSTGTLVDLAGAVVAGDSAAGSSKPAS